MQAQDQEEMPYRSGLTDQVAECPEVEHARTLAEEAERILLVEEEHMARIALEGRLREQSWERECRGMAEDLEATDHRLLVGSVGDAHVEAEVGKALWEEVLVEHQHPAEET